MLGKLLGLDLKIYTKMLWKPLLILLIVFVVSVGFTANQFSPLALAAGMISLIVLIGFIIYAQIAHYYRHFYAEQGYLTHTLPASPSQRLWSKLLSGLLLHLLTVGIVLVGFNTLIMSSMAPVMALNNVQSMFQIFRLMIGVEGLLLFVGLLIAMYFSFFATYSLSISLGMSKALQRLRGGGIAIAFLGIYGIGRIVGSLAEKVPLTLRMHLNPRWYQMLEIVRELPVNTDPIGPGGIPSAVTTLDISLISMIYSTLFVIVSFLLVNRELKRINLR